VIAVPSRFEPCGLTQLYGLRYGTLPVVRRVGGLADTVVDADPGSMASGRATGFIFDLAVPAAFERCVRRALAAFEQPAVWRGLMHNAMAQPLGWAGPAKSYLDLYASIAGKPS